MSTIPLTTAPMTELDGVNLCLMAIGGAPVNALDTPGNKDASIARLTLNNLSRKVQSKGWYFNQELSYPLTADSSTGKIALPANCISTATADEKYRVVERGGFLYDLDNRTDVFPAGTTVNVDITFMFPFENLPQVARSYIALAAAQTFQSNIVGATDLNALLDSQVKWAYALLVAADTRSKRPNVLTSNPRIIRMTRRNRGTYDPFNR